MSSYLSAPEPRSPAAGRDELDLARFPMDDLLTGCVENLRNTFDQDAGLFPFITRLVDGRYVNDYAEPQSVRYTINSLLGLNEAARHGVGGVTPDEVGAMTEALLRRGPDRVSGLADIGLLTLLLCELETETVQVDSTVERLETALSATPVPRLDVQSLGWAIWGTAAAARRGVAGADQLARRIASVVEEHFVDPRSRLPRHSTRWYRRSIVSFGSLTYYLRAAHELAVTLEERRWQAAFESGVRHAIAFQGPLGEWPWMMDVRSGTPFDAYPVFSVHQDSMAMLFLLPALERDVP
jgi:hypothetical protein